MTATIKPYIPNIPAIIMGIIFFMTAAGLVIAIPAKPFPDLAVPYAAPALANIKADATPM